MLLGHYGPQKQAQIETEIAAGSCKLLDKDIKAGKYGKRGLMLLKQRPKRRKSSKPCNIDKMLSKLFPDIFASAE